MMLTQAAARQDIHPSLKDAILALLWSLSCHLTQVTHTMVAPNLAPAPMG